MPTAAVMEAVSTDLNGVETECSLREAVELFTGGDMLSSAG